MYDIPTATDEDIFSPLLPSYNTTFPDNGMFASFIFEETSEYCINHSEVKFKLFRASTQEFVDLVGNIPVWKNLNNFIITELSELSPFPTEFNIQDPYPNPFN